MIAARNETSRKPRELQLRSSDSLLFRPILPIVMKSFRRCSVSSGSKAVLQYAIGIVSVPTLRTEAALPSGIWKLLGSLMISDGVAVACRTSSANKYRDSCWDPGDDRCKTAPRFHQGDLRYSVYFPSCFACLQASEIIGRTVE